MNTRSGRSAGMSLWIGLLLVILLSGCGGGAGGGGSTGPVYDPAAANAELELGKGELVNLVDGSGDLTGFPYDDATSITGHFEKANGFDPTLDEVKFWSGLTSILTFLNSDETRAFLAKLGWESLNTEVGNLFERVGQYFSTPITCDYQLDPQCVQLTPPPLHAFYLPNDPNKDDPHPCIGDPAQPGYETCVTSADGWLPFNVYFMGHPEDGASADSFISFQDLYIFFTQTLGDAVHGAVAKLKSISPDFSTSLTVTIPDSQGNPQLTTYTFGRFEVSVAQALYGILDVATSLPTIWTWDGVDEFAHTYMNDPAYRDPTTGAPTDLMPDLSAAAVDYFQQGMNGGPLPLQSNAAGTARLNGALSDLLGAVQGILGSVVAAKGELPTALSGFQTTVYSYDDQPKVLTYGLAAISGTLGEVRSSFAGNTAVNLYLPIATVQDFGVCTPGGSAPADPIAGNTANSAAFPATVADLTAGYATSTLAQDDSQSITVDPVAGGLPPVYGSAYEFVFTVPTDQHFSIWAEDLVSGANVDTFGDLAYVDTSANLVAWDSDDNSNGALHFGLSVDHLYMTDGTTMPSIDTTGNVATFVLMVQDRTNTTGFRLHIQTTTTDTPSQAMPIFLKGGPRNFLAKTYSVGVVQVNLGKALTAASRFFEDSERNTFVINKTTDPQTLQDVYTPSLMYSTTALRNKLRDVFPSITIPPDNVLNQSTEIDIFDTATLTSALSGVMIGGVSVTEVNPIPAPQFNTQPFCAYPQYLSTMNVIPGGFLVFGY